MHQKVYTLKTASLKARVLEKGLKHESLAALIKVSPLTINRWMTGKTKRIYRENLKSLLRVLSCEIEDITTANCIGDQSSDQQKKLAEELLSQKVLDQLNATQNYTAVEGILNLVINDEFSKELRNELYFRLASNLYRQWDLDRAEELVQGLMVDLSREPLDYYLRVHNLYGLILGAKGRHKAARQKFESLLTLIDSSIGPRTRFHLYLNYGLSLMAALDFTQAAAFQKKALNEIERGPEVLTKTLDKPGILGNLIESLLLSGHLPEARRYFEQLESLVALIPLRYRRYRYLLIKFRLELRSGESSAAATTFRQIEQDYSDLHEVRWFTCRLENLLNQGLQGEANAYLDKLIADKKIAAPAFCHFLPVVRIYPELVQSELTRTLVSGYEATLDLGDESEASAVRTNEKKEKHSQVKWFWWKEPLIRYPSYQETPVSSPLKRTASSADSLHP